MIETGRSITQRGLDESSTRLLPKFGTVVVARGATTGRFCMVGCEMAMNQTCYALESLHKRPFWLNCAFNNLVDRLVHAAHGSVFDTITTKTVDGARVLIPSPDLLQRFEDMVSPLFECMLSNIRESRCLARTRDHLLPKLLSGEIRIKDTEQLIGSTV